MLTIQQMNEIVQEIDYKGFKWRVGTQGGKTFMWVDIYAWDNNVLRDNKLPFTWKVSINGEFRDEDSFISACRSVVHQIEQHETDERFKYKGDARFHPHRFSSEFDPDVSDFYA